MSRFFLALSFFVVAACGKLTFENSKFRSIDGKRDVYNGSRVSHPGASCKVIITKEKSYSRESFVMGIFDSFDFVSNEMPAPTASMSTGGIT